MSMSGTWTLQSFSVCFRLGQLGGRGRRGREGERESRRPTGEKGEEKVGWN